MKPWQILSKNSFADFKYLRMVSAYTRCLAQIKPEEGSDFSLYDGFIQGKIVTLEKDAKIV